MANGSLEKELVLLQLKIFGDGYSMPSFMVAEKGYSEKEAFKALLQKIMHNNYWGYNFDWWLEALEDILMKLDPALHAKIKKKKEYEEYFDWEEELLEQCLKYPIEQVLNAIGDFVGYGSEFKATPYKLRTIFV